MEQLPNGSAGHAWGEGKAVFHGRSQHADTGVNDLYMMFANVTLYIPGQAGESSAKVCPTTVTLNYTSPR